MDFKVYSTLLKEKNLDAMTVLEKLGYQNMSPIELRRIFLLLSKACFSTTENYNMQSGFELTDPPVTYSDDKYAKKIDVELDYVYDAAEVNVRPAVYIGFGDITFQRQAIGDYSGISDDNSTIYCANQAQTSLHLRHITTSPDLCYALADTSVQFYLALQHLLEESLPGLGDFNIASVSKINILDPDKERNFRVDVVFNLTFMFAWKIVSEGHRLKEINFNRMDHQ